MILILTFQNDVLYSHASFDIFPAIRLARVFRVRMGLRTDVAELALPLPVNNSDRDVKPHVTSLKIT